jgi:hypothetical protein
MPDDPALFQELDSNSRRRLWLLQFLLERLEPEEALNLAQQMEGFILGSAARDHRSRSKSGAGSGATERNDGWAVRPESAPHERDPDDAQQRGRLLGDDSLREFAEAIAAGLSNAELASRFGFTPRQANGLRMGLTRRNPALRAPQDGKPPQIDRATELKLQEAFLQKKATPAPTLDDVVQFLRQRGDVVFRSGTGFSVNNRLTLTAEELVARANRKRSELGQAPFAEHVGSVDAPSGDQNGVSEVTS